MSQLKVHKQEDGSPAISCPRCDELVAPDKNGLFNGHDCPSCEGTIDTDELRNYLRALRIFNDGGGHE